MTYGKFRTKIDTRTRSFDRSTVVRLSTIIFYNPEISCPIGLNRIIGLKRLNLDINAIFRCIFEL